MLSTLPMANALVQLISHPCLIIKQTDWDNNNLVVMSISDTKVLNTLVLVTKFEVLSSCSKMKKLIHHHAVCRIACLKARIGHCKSTSAS